MTRQEEMLFRACEPIFFGDPVCLTGERAGVVRARADTMARRHVIAIACMEIQEGARFGPEALAFPNQVVSCLNPDIEGPVRFLGSEGGLALHKDLGKGDFMIRVGYRVQDEILFVAIQDLGRKG